MKNKLTYLQSFRQVARLLLPVLLAIMSLALLWPKPERRATEAPAPSSSLSSPKQAVKLDQTVAISATLEQAPSWLSNENDYTYSLAWGDVDADGDLDLAVGNHGPNKLYLNEGGILSQSASWQSNESDQTQSVAWGDVDADGDLDLAVGNANTQENKLYLNENGELSLSADWQSNESDQTQSVAWGDVDADGDLDLVVGNDGNPNKLYENEDGMLSLNASWQSDESDATFSLAWGDVDADGDLDLAIGNSYQPNKLYLNESGTLSQSANWQSNESDPTLSVAWADVDADGNLDLAVGNEFQPNKLYLNEGGTLTLSASWQSNESNRTKSVAWADVDADGDLDLAVGNQDNPNKLYLNEGGTLALSPSWQSNESDNSQSIAWADMDADGALDLVIGNSNSQRNKLYEGEGPTLSASWQSNESDRTVSLAWGDVDADGDLDLSVGNEDEPNKLYLNEGETLSASSSWQSNGSHATYGLAWGDVDADGDLDLAIGDSPYQPTKLYEGEDGMLSLSTSWQSNDGDATYSAAWGDVDSDGDLDLAVGNYYQANKLYLNEGGMLSLNASWQSNDSDSTYSVAWGDVDADGDLDLAVGNTSQANKLYLNDNGMLTSSASWQSNDSDQTRSVAWGDVDADGDLDLAVGNNGQGNKLYLNEDGMLNLNASWQSNESEPTYSVAWGDMDGDGDLDLAVGNYQQPNKLYKNEGGTLSHSASWQSNESDETYSVVWGDVDGDGSLDLAFGNRFATNKLYLNQRPAHPLHPNQSVAMQISALAHAPANFYALPKVQEGVIPITYTLSHPAESPIGKVRAFYSPDGGGRWLEALATSETMTSNLVSNGEEHVYHWDVLASGFFGQSDNVVLRLEALPNQQPIANSIPGPFQRPFVSAQTYPFRVRGSQVQVLSNTLPVADALVYRLPAGQTTGALSYANNAGQPFRTNAQGYLSGRGDIAIGDTLIALLPITTTESYTLYHTSATPTETGLEGVIVQEQGVQQLVVSADNPLILFDLDISLEWDARNDDVFLEELQNALQRSSQVLYDVSNGQMALGEVRVHQAKENWLNADLALFASPDIHPSATLGGVVITPTNEIGASGVLTNAYWPGQIRMGPSWDPYGLVAVDLAQDWWRALAHELGHYLLYLPDNYIGIKDGAFKPTDCQDSFMTNTSDDGYSEFLTAAQWDELEECQYTVAEYTTGRSDWETITHFYPMLQDSPVNLGPAVLPLAVTQVTFVPPATASSSVLPAEYFDLRDAESGALLLLPEGRGYLIKTSGTSDLSDDILINLGETGGPGDRIMVRGAEENDRICLSGADWLGCEQITTLDRSVQLSQAPDWQPNIQITPLSPLTLAVTVTLQTPVTELNVQVLPATGHPFTPTITYAPSAPMIALDPANPITFTQVITLNYPAFTGSVRIWTDSPAREAMSEYFLSIAAWGGDWSGWGGDWSGWGGDWSGWGGDWSGWGGDWSGWGGNSRGWGAPLASGDGQVTVLNIENPFNETGIAALQSLTNLPHLPAWFTVVGQGYRVTQDADLTEPIKRTISFDYLQRDVPAGYEFSLRIYYSPDDGTSWQQLPTELDTDENLAVAVMPLDAAGIYALISTVELALPNAGWNLFSYPVQATRPVSEALQSISSFYSTVFGYENSAPANPWRVYHNLPELQWMNDLHQLEYAKGYWINSSQAITLSLDVTQEAQASRTMPSNLSHSMRPPATYYGHFGQEVQPEAGQTVSAWIGEALCGEGQTQLVDGQVMYALHVWSSAQKAGCGDQREEGRIVSFHLGSQRLATTARWDNRQPWHLPLERTLKLYLPLVQ